MKIGYAGASGSTGADEQRRIVEAAGCDLVHVEQGCPGSRPALHGVVPALRPGDEVLVVHPTCINPDVEMIAQIGRIMRSRGGELIAIGQAGNLQIKVLGEHGTTAEIEAAIRAAESGILPEPLKKKRGWRPGVKNKPRAPVEPTPEAAAKPHWDAAIARVASRIKADDLESGVTGAAIALRRQLGLSSVPLNGTADRGLKPR